MPGTYLAQVCLAADSSIPADVAINTYHFAINGDGPGPFDFTDEQVITGERPGGPDENGINGDLSDLYVTLGSLLSVNIDPAASRIKWYNLSDPPPRIPVLELPLDPLFTTSTSGLPSEVAICSSFQSARVSGVNQARRRNRIYFGPLSLGTIVGPPYGIVAPTVRTAIADAFENLSSNSETQPYWTWVVYSGTTGLSTPITDGWVDDAFDTQRRRGAEPAVRTVWSQDSE